MMSATDYELDKEYQGEKRFTIACYLEAEPGFMKNLKSKKRVFATFDASRHCVFLHSTYEGGKYYYTIPFLEITNVTCDISQRDKNRWYTTIFGKRAFTLLFKCHHGWFTFTEAFRHLYKEGVKDGLFKTNATYLEFETTYLTSPQRRYYRLNPKPQIHNEGDELPSDDEHHRRIHLLNNDAAPKPQGQSLNQGQSQLDRTQDQHLSSGFQGNYSNQQLQFDSAFQGNTTNQQQPFNSGFQDSNMSQQQNSSVRIVGFPQLYLDRHLDTQEELKRQNQLKQEKLKEKQAEQSQLRHESEDRFNPDNKAFSHSVAIDTSHNHDSFNKQGQTQLAHQDGSYERN
jgi:hypothetical protein